MTTVNEINIWFARNRIKKGFLRKNGITTGLPVLEFLIAARFTEGVKGYFAIKEVWPLLKANNLQKTEQTLYKTARYCSANAFIAPLTTTRQWFCPIKYHVTDKGLVFLMSFGDYMKKYSSIQK